MKPVPIRPPATPEEVLDFWFGSGPEPPWALWFGKDPAVDAALRVRFEATHQAALAGALDSWLEAPDSALALTIVLDQLPRNMYRDTPAAFAADAKARACARTALDRGFDSVVPPLRRMFLYLPFEHSEDLAEQRLSVKLFAALDDEPGVGNVYDYALRHYYIIARFGRFPHRNAILGRENSAEESAFLATPGSGF